MKIWWSKCLLVALALSMWSLPATAQVAPGRGTIAGQVVSGDTRAPLVGARVEVVSAVGQTITGTITDQAGRYRLENVAPGSYTLVVNTIGYEGRRIENVTVTAGQTTSTNAELVSRAIQLNPVVVTASRQQERVLDAPASVQVVGVEQIEVRPTVTPTDHLRALPGVDVVSQGLQSANVVTRGFNNIFSGALLALTDHRIAAIPSLRVNALYMVPSTNEDIERIEVVLGPGSALYGPNTANGVLHMFTKSPLVEQRTTLSLTGGERSVLQGSFRTSYPVNDNLGVKVSAQYLEGDEWPAVDSVEVATRRDAVLIDPETRIGLRDYELRRWAIEGRADWRVTPSLTTIFQAGRSTTASGIELTGLGAAQIRDWSYDFYQMRATTGRLFAQVYLNTSNAGQTYTLRDAEPVVDESRFLVAQLQHGASLGARQSFTYGADYLRTMPETRRTIHGQHEDDDIIDEVGVFLQSETALTPQFNLVLAGRYDYHSWIDDPVFSPRAALVFKPDQNNSFRVTYNRAFSTPGSVQLFLDKGAGAAPGDLGALGYGIHAQGTYTGGFTFRQPDGSYRMRSPFSPLAGEPSTTLLTADPATAYGLAARVAAARSGLPPAQAQALAGLLMNFQPLVASQVGLVVLNPLAPGDPPVPLASATIADIPGIRESNTTTYEVGYKGILARRLLLAADLWYSQKDNFISPLTVSTPLLLLDGQQLAQTLGAPLTQALMQGLGLPAAVAQEQAAALIGGMARLPVGVISSAEVNADGPALLVTYRNFGEVDLYGLDLSATALLTDQFTLTVGASFVNDDHFITEGQVIALNAPKRKGSFALGYRNDGMGVTGELRARYNAQFPVNSGVYIGMQCIDPGLGGSLGVECVDSYTLLDMTLGYQIPQLPGTSVQLMVQNLTDRPYRGFVGVPEIGRLALLRLRYEF